MKWNGVMPALTTAFDANLKIDHAFVARHALWQIENGVSGLVALGSLGEAGHALIRREDCTDRHAGGSGRRKCAGRCNHFGAVHRRGGQPGAGRAGPTARAG